MMHEVEDAGLCTVSVRCSRRAHSITRTSSRRRSMVSSRSCQSTMEYTAVQ